MRFSGLLLIIAATILFTTVSCQRELNFDKSCGTLLDSAGSCRPSVLYGEYRAAQVLGSGNYLDIQISVVTPGPYMILSDTVNGYSFKAIGSFNNSGNNSVRLYASGKPLQQGINTFTINYCNTSCSFTVNVLPPSVPPAQVELGGAPGGCTGVIVGTYVTGVAMNASNVVVQDVIINSTGPYTISTDTVNGVYFAASGTFTNTGNQTIDLVGNGTPLAAGVFTFTLTAGTSFCTFQITFAPAADYFPLTQNSFWTYSNALLSDSLYKLSSATTTLAGNSYRKFLIGLGTVGSNQYSAAAFRKSGSNFYQYLPVDTFTNVALDAPVLGEIPFLDEAATVGTTWSSTEFSGTESGVPVKIRYSFRIASSGGNLVVNGITYSNVKKVYWQSQVDYNNTGYQPELELESYFALGVGLIQFRFTDVGSTTWIYEDDLLHYQVF